jgi:hypothetical protein
LPIKRSATVGRCLGIMAVTLLACANARNEPVVPVTHVADGGGGNTSGAGGGQGGSSGSTGSIDGAVEDGSSGCASGQHLCAGVCVADDSPASCGSSCEPCPSVAGGTTGCKAGKCEVTCPTGQKACLDKCIAATDACSGSCQPGSHDCGGVCVDGAKVANCGTLCAPCPAAPAGGVATCDGTACGFSCDVGKRCGDKCGECCADGDCTAQMAKTVTCDLATLKCKYACPAGQKDCSGTCIDAAGCCKDGDCAMMGSQVGKCDSSAHQCGYACPGDTKLCAGKCIPSGSCCDDKACTANFACVNNACSTTTCAGNFALCGSTCIPKAGCCEDKDCTGDFACVGHVCSKTMCRGGFKSCNGNCIPSDGCCNDGTPCGQGGICKGGKCLACDPAAKPTCQGTAVKRCMPDGSGFGTTPCDRGCSGGVCCGGGTESAGGACAACGGNGQACCKVANPDCGGGLSCQGNKCAPVCGAQTACRGGDNCCPPGNKCTAVQDSDCPAVCGNGAVEPGETCDPCPKCPPSAGCTIHTPSGSGCNLRCDTSTQTRCQNNDNCCPGGCDATNDNDCRPVCGNGKVEAGETCDPCPAPDCPDKNCHHQKVGGSKCNPTCVQGAVITCANACLECNNATSACQEKPGFPGGFRGTPQAQLRSNGSGDWNCDGNVVLSPTVIIDGCEFQPGSNVCAQDRLEVIESMCGTTPDTINSCTADVANMSCNISTTVATITCL